jgi:uncharacterized protein (DUF885 family)
MKNNILIFLIALSACNNTSNKNTSMQGINQLLDAYYEERLQLFPLEATAIADDRYNDVLPADISNSYRLKLKDFYHKYLEAILAIDTTRLDEQELISYEVFRREMNIQLEGLTFKDNLKPINQFWSMHLTFPLLGSGSGNQPFKSVKDYDNFLGRMHDFSAYIDTAIFNMREGVKENIVPPKILMERVLPQLKEIIVDDPVKSVFYDPVKNMPDAIPPADKSRLTEAYKKSIMEDVVASYRKLYDFIATEYMPQCMNTAGISANPGGREYYAYLAKVWTTTEMTPDEIYETGQREVARIRSEMEKVMKETGYKGDLKSFFNYLHTDKKFMPFKTDEEVINAYRSIEERMKPRLKEYFNLTPKAKFEVRQTEKFREASGSAEYVQSAPDGSRPGIFYVPVLDATKFNVVGMEDLFLHEAIPGHHYQTAIQQENDSLPKFRRFGWYGAYGEGWALYTESLGKELGLYTDPYQYFGCLNEEMHRAIRLVVDVGMHLKGWTREEALAFSFANDAESEADITAEIERYMAIPGQALAYKIGQLKIMEIRKRAEEKLGDKFSIKDFHDEVLKDGCLPLDVFEAKMNRWLERQSIL